MARRAKPERQRCKGKKKKTGEPCTKWAVDGTDWCWGHDPKNEALQKALGAHGSKGGRGRTKRGGSGASTKGRKRRSSTASQTNTGTSTSSASDGGSDGPSSDAWLAPIEDPPTADLRTTAGQAHYLDWLARMVLAGHIDEKRSRALLSIVESYGKLRAAPYTGKDGPQTAESVLLGMLTKGARETKGGLLYKGEEPNQEEKHG